MQLIGKNTLNFLLVITGVAFANFLFWEEKFGVNSLLFAIFWLISLIWLFPESRQSRPFWATAIGTILSAVMVLMHNSDASKVAYLLSISTTAGFAQASELRFLWHAFMQYVSNFTAVPGLLLSGWRSNEPATKPKKSMSSWVSMSLIPLVVASVFYLLYYWANEKFAAISDRFWSKIGRIFSFDFSFEHFFYVFTLSLLVGAAFWKAKNYFAAIAINSNDFLTRKKPIIKRDSYGNRQRSEAYFDSFLGLQKEYQQSLMTLGMLNLLLLVVNATDFIYVWSGANAEEVKDLKQYVHEGTYILITCILMAMGVLFHIFRKNLNFYPKNTVLLYLSLGWLVQNGILALSVGIRNWQYVSHHGFAYKRVGVFLFLLLVFFGLVTLWLKIRDRRSMSWLLRFNAWAFYGLLLLNSLVPWDQWITNYNLSAPLKSVVDVRWMIFEVSDKNIRILEDNLELLKSKPAYPAIEKTYIEQSIDIKRKSFDAKMAKYSWKSWNFADEACKRN
jgi:hypothetical protein